MPTIPIPAQFHENWIIYEVMSIEELVKKSGIIELTHN